MVVGTCAQLLLGQSGASFFRCYAFSLNARAWCRPFDDHHIYINFKVTESHVRAQEVCESRGGRPGHPVPVSPYGLCARKATLNSARVRAQEVCGGRGGRNGPYGLCGRKAALNSKESLAWNRMDLIRERSSAVCTCFAR